MPLHSQGERPGAVNAKRLDQPVIGDGLDADTPSQPSDALPMQRIDLDCCSAGEFTEQTAFRQGNRMRRAVLHLQRGVRIFIVPVISGYFVHLLMQAAAKHDIQFLKTATDRKQWHAGSQGFLCKRQGCGIAVRIVQRARLTGIAGVVMRLNIGRTTGQQESIDMAEDRIQIDAVTQSRYQKGHRIGTIANRRDVFLPHHMKGVRIEQSPIRRYSYYWLGRHKVRSGFRKR